METEQRSERGQGLAQTAKPAAYTPAVWPVVESKEVDNSFEEDAYQRLSQQHSVSDPMFADFDEETRTTSLSAVEGQNLTSVLEGIEEAVADVTSLSVEDARLDQEAEGSQAEESAYVAEYTDQLQVDPELFHEPDVAVTPLSDDMAEVTDDVLEASHPSPIPEAVEVTTQMHVDDGAEQEPTAPEEAHVSLDPAYAEGIAAGRAEMAEMRAQLEARYEELFADLQAQYKETLHNTERQAVDLAFQVAQKLVGAVLETDREYIRVVLAQALQAASGSEVMHVRVSPQDFAFLSLNKVAEGIQAKQGGSWSFQSDDSIRAGCIVTTKAGEIDFDLDATWNRMREKVLRGPKS